MAELGISPSEVSFQRPYVIDSPKIIQLNSLALTGAIGFGGTGVAYEGEL